LCDRHFTSGFQMDDRLLLRQGLPCDPGRVSGPVKLVILVSGTHKDKKKRKQDRFTPPANNRVVELCTKFHAARKTAGTDVPAPAVLRFIHFHAHTDTVRFFDYQLSLDDKNPPPSSVGKKWKRVTAGNTELAFVDRVTPLKITNVYHTVRSAPAQSVMELDIFSHAIGEGPIIRDGDGDDDDLSPTQVNTPLRKPNDPSGRVRADFAPNMGEDPQTTGKDALKQFKAAFHPNASFIIFGCNARETIRKAKNSFDYSLRSTAGHVINQVYTRPVRAYDYRVKNSQDPRIDLGAKVVTGKVEDDFEVTINMGEELNDERAEAISTRKGKIFDKTDRDKDLELRRAVHYGIDNDPFFAGITALQFKKKWNLVLGLVARRTQKTYAFQAATALTIDVISGPVGTSSAVESSNLQRVCGDQSVSDCTRRVRFHQLYMRPSPSHPKDESIFRLFVFDKATLDFINKLALK
jgi:hypothetical protein